MQDNRRIDRLRRVLVENGYTHSFCTPHIWTSLPANTVANIPTMVAALQTELEKQKIPLKLIPGGENNIQPELFRTVPDEVVTFGMSRRFCLVDLWADKLPEFFTTNVKWLQSLGLTVILRIPSACGRCRMIRASWIGSSRWACCCRGILAASATRRTRTIDARGSDCSRRIGISVWGAICMGSIRCRRGLPG